MAAKSTFARGDGVAFPRRAARPQARWRGGMPLVYAAVSALTFAVYALAVSAAGAPPSVHAAGLVLWVAHVMLLFGRTPSQKLGLPRGLGELRRPEALDRAADAAASLSVRRDSELPGGRPDRHVS